MRRCEEDARYVSPDASFPRIIFEYSGFAETSIPTNDVYTLTKLESMVVHGIPMTASTRAECMRSSRDTTCDSAIIHSLSCEDVVIASFAARLGLNWSTSSSKASVMPYEEEGE